MAYIGKKPEDLIRGNATYNAFTGDGSTTTFDVTNLLPDGGSFDVEVFVDNVRQEAGSSKSYTIGQDGSGDLKRITFSTAPDDGAEIYVINPGRETSLITVADDTISTAKLQSTSVTTAKIAADAVTGAKIADDAINSEHITDGSVDNVHLAGSIANAKLANSSITINGTSINLGASGDIVAGTDWQAVVVADGSTQLTAVAGRGYFLDTNAGVIEVTLPSSPSRGDTFIFADYGNNFAQNKVVIDTAGKLIDSTQGGVPDRDFVLNTNGQIVELIYKDSTSGYMVKQNNSPSALTADSYDKFIEATGGTITTTGNFKIHSFTGDGCFVVSQAGEGLGPSVVDYLVIAGGGSGGIDNGGGGGAGGYRESSGAAAGCYTRSPLGACVAALPVSATTYPVTVGGGGAVGPGPVGSEGGTPGSNSVFSTITSAGGGGGSHTGPTGCQTAMSGGSGGGAGQNSTSPNAGTGNTPPVSPPQGNNGGYNGPGPTAGGGGGGGAGAVGSGGNSTNGYNGAAGVTSCITASPVQRAAGGGGGGGQPGSGTGGSGGAGGGGAGGPGTTNGTAGTANTGSGGGGGGQSPPSPRNNVGGKGLVVIRYKFQDS